MPLTDLHHKILAAGARLMSRLRYELPTTYDRHRFLLQRHFLRKHLEDKIVHALYQKHV